MIRWARLERKPFIGTCAGFQHAVLEFARNVLGINDAMHAEYDLNASDLIVTPLTGSLVGKQYRPNIWIALHYLRWERH
jgi:CTP synthase (UTP-ammonia lyase)